MFTRLQWERWMKSKVVVSQCKISPLPLGGRYFSQPYKPQNRQKEWNRVTRMIGWNYISVKLRTLKVLPTHRWDLTGTRQNPKCQAIHIAGYTTEDSLSSLQTKCQYESFLVEMWLWLKLSFWRFCHLTANRTCWRATAKLHAVLRHHSGESCTALYHTPPANIRTYNLIFGLLIRFSSHLRSFKAEKVGWIAE